MLDVGDRCPTIKKTVQNKGGAIVSRQTGAGSALRPQHACKWLQLIKFNQCHYDSVVWCVYSTPAICFVSKRPQILLQTGHFYSQRHLNTISFSSQSLCTDIETSDNNITKGVVDIHVSKSITIATIQKQSKTI